MGVWTKMATALAAQCARQVSQMHLWFAFFWAAGIGSYFWFPIEPGYWPIWGIFGIGSVWCIASIKRPFVMCLAILVIGYGWAGVTAHRLTAPILDKRMYGPVTGTVLSMDRSASDKPRIILGNVRLGELTPDATPSRVRVALHGPGPPPNVGDEVGVLAHLSPPPGPAEPYGFDFQRHAWFLQLGGVGYARKPVSVLSEGQAPFLQTLRSNVSSWVLQNLSVETAGIGVAITTGDRSALDKEVTQNLRESNLAHLLAISGLHMGLLVGLVFGVVRFLLIWVPWGDAKRNAACVALVVGLMYLLLSGASIATERAFVMASVVLMAVILRKRALTLRAVALAVWIVLLLRPQAIFSPGFHMSFAATIALIVVFQWISHWRVFQNAGIPRYLFSAVLSAGVAGAATAPFAAAHFNMIPHYGIVANVAAVPIMAMVVMPSVLCAVILAPMGLEWLPFMAMDWGLSIIIDVATIVSSWGGAVSHVKAPGPAVLPIFTVGAVVLILWQGWWRWGGAVLAVIALTLWMQTPRPDILISDSATLVGIMGPEGRVMSREKGSGFSARVWLENDGDDVSQLASSQRALPNMSAITVIRKWPEDADPCNETTLVVAEYVRDANCPIFDLRRLRRTGSVAGYYENGYLKWISARSVSGRRLWNNRWVRRDAQTDRFWMRSYDQLPNQ